MLDISPKQVTPERRGWVGQELGIAKPGSALQWGACSLRHRQGRMRRGQRSVQKAAHLL